MLVFSLTLFFALSAHVSAKDGGYLMAFVAMIMIVISRVYDKKVF
jgi:hypothetical protein